MSAAVLLPPQVRAFIQVAASAAESAWNDKDAAEDLLCVEVQSNGCITISDAYKRFFSTTFTYICEGVWRTRQMYSINSDEYISYDDVLRLAAHMYEG